jgi:hypothetical protein
MFIGLPDFRRVEERLLEVVADELVRFVPTIEPSRCALVEFSSLRLWDAAIRDLANEDVMEAVEISLHRMDETSLGKGQQQPHRILLRCEVAELDW